MSLNSTWLAFMLIPFIIGVMIHFIIPIQFILTTNSKIQNIYNTYKIEIEQDSIRAVSVENARVFQNSIQMYENLRANYVRLFNNPNAYEDIRTEKMDLNCAFHLAVMDEAQFFQQELDRSMWYVPHVERIQEMNSIERGIYQQLAQIEPFLLSVFTNKSEIYDGLQSFKTTINHHNQTFYLQYPSTRSQQFSTLTYNPLNQVYNATVFNYLQNDIEETLIVEGEVVEICEPLFEDGDIMGVSCMGINLTKFMKVLAETLYVPEFELSDNEYYLVKPKYEGIDQEDEPKIIMYFSEENFSNLTFPSNSTFATPEYLGSVTFSEKKNFELYVYRYAIGFTYYVIPISIVDYNDRETIDMYMIVLNHFRTSELNLENRESRMLTATFVPSTIMLLISIVGTLIVLKWLFGDLAGAINDLNDYCSLILKGDIELKIPDYKGASDLTQLFAQFQILNQLHKYSDPRYFDIPKPDRISRYLRCYKLFEKLGYDLGNLSENIADCYATISQFKNSIRHMQISVDATLEALQEKEGNLDQIFYKKYNKEKMSSKSKSLQKVLRRRLDKLIHFTYYSYHLGDKSPHTVHQIKENLNLLKQVAYPKIINFEYLAALMIELRLKFESKEENLRMEDELARFDNLLSAYEEQYEKYFYGPEIQKASPDILRGHWWAIKAEMLQSQGKIQEAFWHYTASLSQDLYDPYLHAVSNQDLKKLLCQNGINLSILDQMVYNQNYQPRKDREYIFLFDVCRPDIDPKLIQSWKKNSREMTEYIFDSFIKDNDKVSSIEFCTGTKINFSQIAKKQQKKLIKKELLSSIRTRKQTSFCELQSCLLKATNRVAHMTKQKYFITFVKPEIEIDGIEVLKLVKEVPNSKFIFIMEDPLLLQNREEGYFILDFENGYQDIERILQQKQHKSADNSVYVF